MPNFGFRLCGRIFLRFLRTLLEMDKIFSQHGNLKCFKGNRPTPLLTLNRLALGEVHQERELIVLTAQTEFTSY